MNNFLKNEISDVELSDMFVYIFDIGDKLEEAMSVFEQDIDDLEDETWEKLSNKHLDY